MILSLALPNNSSLKEKNMLVSLANEAGLGIFVSDLPQNHDLFQLLTLWRQKYSKLPNLGTAIISPLIYNKNFLLKQVRTLFEIHKNGLELGLGIGDKNLLPKTISNRIIAFQDEVSALTQDELIKNSDNQLSIAGSGSKLITFANSLDLGLIYNGLIDNQIVSTITSSQTKDNLSTYIMTDIHDFDSLTIGFVTIVSRIVTGLSSRECQRLNIDSSVVESIREELLNKNISDYKNWLPEEVIRKVALFGTKEEILNQLKSYQSLNIKQVILSIVGTKNKLDFIEYYKHH